MDKIYNKQFNDTNLVSGTIQAIKQKHIQHNYAIFTSVYIKFPDL